LSISAVAALLNRGSLFCANFKFGVPEPMWDAIARTIVGADDRREPVSVVGRYCCKSPKRRSG
jgi:hypothetical protein